MKIEQFYDKGLAHASYAIVSDGEMAVIDPARDPQQYFDFADKNNAKIVAIIETHPHADFVSSHAEISKKTAAPIYVSKLLGADYPHKTFDDGDTLKIGKAELRAMNTPGHSPDSISILVLDESKNKHAIFTGDTLFVGDVGRPDLRENVGSIQAKREELAGKMYHSLRDKLMKLPDETIVYPAHGPGSLCGKNMSPDLFSTIGREKKENYALKEMDKDRFISVLLEEQPFIPKYFAFDVSVNKKGADELAKSMKEVPVLGKDAEPESGIIVVDTRPRKDFENGHVKDAINIMDGGKFETWLGSIIGPDEKFYLIVKDESSIQPMIKKAAKIGYEKNIKGVLLNPSNANVREKTFDLDKFKSDMDAYTIVDIRNDGEVKSGKTFSKSIAIPLPELRERVREIPAGKPIVIHCAGGYRSAAGASIVQNEFKDVPVYDMSEAINLFNKK